MPKVQIIYISIRYSIARWDWVEPMREANVLIAEYIKSDPNSSMIGPDGTPRRDFLANDGLDLSDAGFAHWTAAISPVIKAAEKH